MDDGGDAGLEWIRDATLCELLEIDHRDVVHALPTTATATATATAVTIPEVEKPRGKADDSDKNQGKMVGVDKVGKTKGGDLSVPSKSQPPTTATATATATLGGVKPSSSPAPRPPVLLTDYVTDLVTAVLYAPSDRDNFVRW